jgi:hypothetical protein
MKFEILKITTPPVPRWPHEVTPLLLEVARGISAAYGGNPDETQLIVEHVLEDKMIAKIRVVRPQPIGESPDGLEVNWHEDSEDPASPGIYTTPQENGWFSVYLGADGDADIVFEAFAGQGGPKLHVADFNKFAHALIAISRHQNSLN